MKERLFFLYQWFVAAPLLLIISIVIFSAIIVGGLFNSNWWGYYPPRIWAKLFCILLFIKVQVRNANLLQRKQAYVFVANHQGAYDIFSIFGYVNHPFRWMMRKGLRNFPLIGQASHITGQVMVDTSNARGIIKTFEDAQKQLKRGSSLVIFPEGRRSDDGNIQPFKHGAFKLATKFKLPIVPLTIDGSYDVMPRSTFNITPGKIIITIHQPILPEQFGSTTDVCEQAYQRIISALPQR